MFIISVMLNHFILQDSKLLCQLGSSLSELERFDILKKLIFYQQCVFLVYNKDISSFLSSRQQYFNAHFFSILINRRVRIVHAKARLTFRFVQSGTFVQPHLFRAVNIPDALSNKVSSWIGVLSCYLVI